MTAAYEPELVRVLDRAIGRLRRSIAASSPPSAAAMEQWIGRLTGARSLVDYFTHLRAFPFMLFPWWMEALAGGSHDLDFQEDLAYSSVSGYLYIRLVDNIMDEPGSAETRILPLANYFHAQFQSAYGRHFAFGDAFWDAFHEIWTRSGESSLVDAGLESIDERCFLDISARKTCAGLIPLVAVCRRLGLKTAPEPWLRAFDLMAAIHQMSNDVFDFQRDLDARRTTYFLSEGARRKRESETLAGWVLREGFDWGVGRVERWLEELTRCAGACGSPGLGAYVELRAVDLRATRREVCDLLRSVRPIMERQR